VKGSVPGFTAEVSNATPRLGHGRTKYESSPARPKLEQAASKPTFRPVFLNEHIFYFGYSRQKLS
jgi:hypothetical protein